MADVLNMLGCCSGAFATFGAVVASYIAFKLLCSIWKGIKCFVLSSGVDFTKLGQWAVVTGATDGIGKAYAQELARRGMNIVLISRNQEKLEDVASEIKSKSNVQTKIIPIDFTGGPEIYSKIDKETSGLDVGVLVNNVGMSYDFPVFFTELDEKKKMDLINVNTTSVTMMTHYFLPRMLAKNKGAILNISSASACLPQALLAVYSATKVYVDFFTKALQQEYQSKGVILQLVKPFFVATKMSKIRKANFCTPSANIYVRAALDTVGVQDVTFGCLSHELLCVKPYFVATKLSKIRKASFFAPSPNTYARAALDTVGVQDVTFGCLPHEIQGYVANKIIPEWLTNSLSWKLMTGARKRGMKKLQAKAD